MSNAQMREVSKIWKETCREIEVLYNLKQREVIPVVYLSTDEDELQEYQPGILKDGSIIVNSKLPDFEKLLPTIIAKLCLQSILPSDLLCKECIDDLSFEFARRRIVDAKVRAKWEDIWSKYSPPMKVSQIAEYYSSDGYRWLQSVSGERGLDTFIRELTHRAKNQIPLSFEDYLEYFLIRGRNFETTLDATELKLVRALIDEPDIQVKQLSDKIDISEEWTSKKISQMRKQRILGRYYRAPFSRIGINMYHLLISRGVSELDPLNLIKDCPFLYAYRRVVSGPWIALATLCIPENKESLQLLRIGLKRIEELGFDIQLHRIHSSGVSSCFDYYVPKEGKWEIPWELLMIHLQRIQLDGLASSIPRIDTPENKTKIELDNLDMKIIDCIGRRITAVSKIRSELRVGQHRIAEKLHKLRENGLIAKSWEIHNIGLNENAIIYCKKNDVSKTIAAWSLRLPRSIISFSSKEELLLIVYLPKGGSYGLATALERLNTDVSIGCLSLQVSGTWGFPHNLWDSKFQRWKCPRQKIDDWINQI
jgi:hypothetical protein